MIKRLAITMLCVAALAVGTTAAAAPKQPIGTQVSLFGGPNALTAEAPFNIQGGWSLDAQSDAIGKFSFSLQVDGVYRTEDFVQRTVSADGTTLARIWVFNFPSGFPAGSHTFTGHWFAPCHAYNACPSDNPNAIIEADQRTLTVTFS